MLNDSVPRGIISLKDTNLTWEVMGTRLAVQRCVEQVHVDVNQLVIILCTTLNEHSEAWEQALLAYD